MTYKIGWDCPNCRLLNGWGATECYRCKAPRPEDAMRDRDPIRPRQNKPDLPDIPPAQKPTPKAPETPKSSNTQPEQKTPVPAEKPAWKKTCLTLAAAFGAGAVVGKLFLPGYVIVIFEAIKQVLLAIGG